MDIASWLIAHLDREDQLDEEVKYLILAALEGDEQLSAQLEVPGEKAQPAAGTPINEEPKRAFLRSISVEGFRGIGPKTEIALAPQPGLVVISGRNGSGKSSLAEGISVALRETTSRAQHRPHLWADQWRNLHHPHAEIRIGLAVEQEKPLEVLARWKDDAKGWEDLECFTQVHGEKRTQGTTMLGWGQAMSTHLPLLSYEELSGLLEDSPSKLYDALSALLGLEEVTEVRGRLEAQLKIAKSAESQVNPTRDVALQALAGIDDPRARECETLIKATRRREDSVAAVKRLLTSDASTADPMIKNLEELLELTAPDLTAVAQAHTRRKEARVSVEAISARGETAAHRTAELLEKALRIHAEHGDQECPVCGQGYLDKEWAAHAADQVAVGKELRQVLEAAKRELTEAELSWKQHFQPVPSALQTAIDLPVAATAHEAWQQWLAAIEADDYVRSLETLSMSLGELHDQAETELARRRDDWAPAIKPLADWVTVVEQKIQAEPTVKRLKAAADWMKANGNRLREMRMEPLADQAREIWASLRQESNVDLANIVLEGDKTKRKVTLSGAVDGQEAGPLAVMSRGELHALALALFIPRATATESPFQFMVIDDPIQAMDPSKINGLLHVLGKLAETRQVIVLSHDDRLPALLRRSKTPARLLTVIRGDKSVVSIVAGKHPVMRYLDDASAIVKSELSKEEKLRVLPGLFRLAVEHQAHSAFWQRQETDGTAWAEIDDRWQELREKREWLAHSLGLGNDQAAFDRWLGSAPHRRRCLGIATSGVHGQLRGDPENTCVEMRKFLIDLGAEL